MAHLFKLIQVDDLGTDTLDLNDGTNYRLMSYTPNVGDGSTVIDTAVIDIMGSTLSAVQTNLNNLNRYVDQAGRHGNMLRGKRVYAQFAAEGATTDVYRSELVTDGQDAARIVWDRKNLDRGYFNTPRLKVSLVFNRRDYWEANDAVTLNGGYNQNGTASAYEVFNCNDGGTTSAKIRNNYVWFPATLFTGDLPAPLEFTIDQQAGTTNTLYLSGNIYNAGTAAASFDHYYEGEDGTAYIAGTASSDSAYSGGAYKSFTWAAASTSFVKVAGWTISDTQAQAIQGGNIRILGMLKQATDLGTVTVQMRFTQNSKNIAYGTEEQLNATDLLQNFGILRLPPYLIASGLSAIGGGTLELWVRDTAGAGLIYIDFLQLNMNDDGFMTVQSKVIDIAQPSGAYYLQEAHDSVGNGTATYGGVIRNGAINAIPGKGLFLTILASGGITTKWAIAPTYRPRRRSVL